MPKLISFTNNTARVHNYPQSLQCQKIHSDNFLRAIKRHVFIGSLLRAVLNINEGA